MSENQKNAQFTKEEHEQWVNNQFQRAHNHLAENGIMFDSVVEGSSRFMAPFVAVWKVKAKDKNAYWVICGDVPADFTIDKNASDPREAVRYFAMHWQLKAENIRKNRILDEMQMKYADLLQLGAENLFSTYENDELWNADVN